MIGRATRTIDIAGGSVSGIGAALGGNFVDDS